MGTNYYAVTEKNKCECCNRSDIQKVHIGKKSYGWAFNFHGHRLGQYNGDWFNGDVIQNLTSWAEYKEWLKTQKIVNEYDEDVSYDSFVQLVESYGSPEFINLQSKQKNKDHITYVLESNQYQDIKSQYLDKHMHWHDNLGYSFSAVDFS